ncbi:MAG: hypothetical protein KJ915_03105 [Candidatus Omnitrophica bacterium]|nr:hypothetical protein [Candidatus Omnitrophota bacterium]
MRKKILVLSVMLFLICATVVASGQWQTYKSAEGAFQLQFPNGSLDKRELVTDTPAGKVKTQMISFRNLTGNTVYTVTANAYPNSLEENSKAVLDGVIQGIKISDRIISEQDVSLQGHAGKRIRYKQHPDWQEVEIAVFVVENYLYMLTADSSNKQEDINIFFDSFQILM